MTLSARLTRFQKKKGMGVSGGPSSLAITEEGGQTQNQLTFIEICQSQCIYSLQVPSLWWLCSGCTGHSRTIVSCLCVFSVIVLLESKPSAFSEEQKPWHCHYAQIGGYQSLQHKLNTTLRYWWQNRKLFPSLFKWRKHTSNHSTPIC